MEKYGDDHEGGKIKRIFCYQTLQMSTYILSSVWWYYFLSA